MPLRRRSLKLLKALPLKKRDKWRFKMPISSLDNYVSFRFSIMFGLVLAGFLPFAYSFLSTYFAEKADPDDRTMDSE